MARDDAPEIHDVAVIGGGPAGLGGALVLARSRRSVVVVDGGEPRNAPAAAVHAFLTRDGTPPAELRSIGRSEVEGYGARLVDDVAVAAEARDGAFAVDLAGGGTLRARRLLVTTGLVDELPDVPGVRDLWGDQVLHCPYCHGWEVRDQAIGVLASGPMATHQALLLRQLSDDVVVFAHTAPPTDEQRVDLAARGVEVVEGEVARLEVEGGRLVGVRTAAGDLVRRQAVAVQPRFVARSGLLESLGVEVEQLDRGLGVRAAADAVGRTAVPGVWVAGNVTDVSAQVMASAAAGAMAGAQINADLVTEEVRRAVEAARA